MGRVFRKNNALSIKNGRATPKRYIRVSPYVRTMYVQPDFLARIPEIGEQNKRN
jgi:hypothetical protein